MPLVLSSCYHDMIIATMLATCIEHSAPIETTAPTIFGKHTVPAIQGTALSEDDDKKREHQELLRRVVWVAARGAVAERSERGLVVSARKFSRVVLSSLLRRTEVLYLPRKCDV